MATVKSQIDITAKDSTAAAFASVNSGLTGLSSTALKVSGALSAIGATAAIGSFAAFTKQTIDAQDELSKLSQKTGIAVESLAGLEFAAEQSGVELDKVAKATRSFSLLVAESADASSSAAKKLTQLGLSYKDLKDLSPEKQLLALSDALSKFSKQDQAVALTSVLGNKMADLIPLLSGGSKELGALIEQGKKFNPVTQQSAKQAELFNDQLNVLSKSISSIGRGLVQEMIPGLSAVADRMAKVTQESGFLKGALAGVKQAFLTATFGAGSDALRDVGLIRKEIEKTEETIAKIALGKESGFFSSVTLSRERERLINLRDELAATTAATEKLANANNATGDSGKKFVVLTDELTGKLDKQVSAQDALQKAQSKSLAVESEYIKLLNIERQAREALIKPYQQEAASAEDRLARMRLEAQALELSRSRQISLEQAIELTTIARLEEKRAMSKNVDVTRELDREIAARKQIITVMRTTEDRTKSLNNVTVTATDEMSQLWIQAGRNIQSALSSSIFDFFSGGLDSMVDNVKNAVLRIMSEFAALKLAQSIGLTDMFTAAGAGGIGGTVSGGGAIGSAGLLSAFATGASGDRLGGFIAGGYTDNAARASTVGSFIGQNTNLAYGGLAYGAASAAGTSSLMTGVATALATFGGPYGALAAAVVIALDFLDKKFGDHEISKGLKPVAEATKIAVNPFYGAEKSINKFEDLLGINVVSKALPGYFVEEILGLKSPDTLIANALFGRGQFKLQNQQFQANVGPDGIQSAALIESYKAKGSAFRSSRTDNIIIDAISGDLLNKFGDIVESGISSRLQFIADARVDAAFGFTEIINEALSGIGDSMRDVAKNLNIGTAGLDTFSAKLTILSEKKELIAEEDFSKEIARITDEMVLSLFPAITEFARRGETMADAFSRLNKEFLTLADAAQNLGSSVADSRSLIGSLGIDKRTDLVEKAGGLGKLSEDTSAFFANFLSDVDRLAVRTSQLNERLKELGLTPDLSREQYKALIESPETSDKTRFGLLDKFTQELFLGVRAQENLIKQQRISISLATSAELDKQRQQQKYNSMLALANGTISAIGQGLNKLLNLAGILKDAQNEVAPQTVEDARASLIGGLNFDRRGNVRGVKGPDYIDQGSIATLASQSTSGFGDRLSFLRSQGKNLEVLQLLSVAVNKSIASERGALQAVASERNRIPIPSFDVGGIVPKTSIAMVHKGERIINPQQNEALVELLQQLITATKSGANYSQSVYNLLKNMTNDGLALNTVAS